MKLDIFRPASASGAGGTASLTGSSATVTPTFNPTVQMPMTILITNAGTDIMMVEFGATATVTTSTAILPNDKQIFDWVSGGSFAVIGVTGTGSTLYWKLGYGA
jgi:hypothetical protein